MLKMTFSRYMTSKVTSEIKAINVDEFTALLATIFI